MSHAAEGKIPGVSVVICCHNSASRIPQTLRHLQVQTGTFGIPWEVILVNNGSTDDTEAVAQRVWAESAPVDLRIVDEPQPGLNHARLRGLMESRFEFLSLIDDDNWVAPDWVRKVFTILSTKPSVAACGGRGSAVSETAPPFWFPMFESAFAVGPQGEREGVVPKERAFLYGAGLTVRASVWRRLLADGHRMVLSDRKGNSLSSGGDSELCHALVLAGWKLWYDPSLTFHHFIPESRLRWDYLRALHRGFGTAAAWLELYKWQIVPPGSMRFRWLPFPESWCCAIRKSWPFQVYATIQTVWRQKQRVGESWRQQECEGSAEVLRMEWEFARAKELVRNPLRYGQVRRSIENAKWSS